MKTSDIEKQGDIEQSYLFHGNPPNSVYNSHVARSLQLRSVTEGFCPWPPKFSKCLTTPSTFFFCLDNNFQMKKFDALRRSFGWKLISPNISKDNQKHLFDLCLSQIFTENTYLRKFKVSVCSHKISPCSKSPHFDGATLNNFGCIYLTEMHAHYEPVVSAFRKERLCGVWWFKFVILKPCHVVKGINFI